MKKEKTIEVIVCDKCGKEVTYDYMEIDYKARHFDICEACADQFLGIKAVPIKGATTCCAPAPEHKSVDWDEVLDSVDAGKKKADSQVGG